MHLIDEAVIDDVLEEGTSEPKNEDATGGWGNELDIDINSNNNEDIPD